MIKLPTRKQAPTFCLENILMFIYGAPKIGKSTFCARFEDALFFATEPGVNFLETYNISLSSYDEVLEALKEIEKGKHSFKTIIIDTVDQLWNFCTEYVRRSRGVESIVDIPYGKGKDLASNAFSDIISRLVKLHLGLVFVSHAKMAEIETINGKVSKMLPTIPDRAREVVLPLVDIIGYAMNEIDINAKGDRIERRLLRVKPSSLWEAGDRTGRLKDPIPLSFYEFKKQYIKEPSKAEEKKQSGSSENNK